MAGWGEIQVFLLQRNKYVALQQKNAYSGPMIPTKDWLKASWNAGIDLLRPVATGRPAMLPLRTLLRLPAILIW